MLVWSSMYFAELPIAEYFEKLVQLWENMDKKQTKKRKQNEE